MTKYQPLLDEFAEAIQGLDDVLKQPKNEFMRDSAIKRFANGACPHPRQSHGIGKESG